MAKPNELIGAVRKRLQRLLFFRSLLKGTLISGAVALMSVLVLKLPLFMSWWSGDGNLFHSTNRILKSWLDLSINYSGFSGYLTLVSFTIVVALIKWFADSDERPTIRDQDAALAIDTTLSTKERVISWLKVARQDPPGQDNPQIAAIIAEQLYEPLRHTFPAALAPYELTRKDIFRLVAGLGCWLLTLTLMLVEPPLSKALTNPEAQAIANISENPELSPELREAFAELSKAVETQGMNSPQTNQSLAKARESLEHAKQTSRLSSTQRGEGNTANSEKRKKPTPTPTPRPPATPKVETEPQEKQDVDIQNAKQEEASQQDAKEAQQGEAKNNSKQEQQGAQQAQQKEDSESDEDGKSAGESKSDAQGTQQGKKDSESKEGKSGEGKASEGEGQGDQPGAKEEQSGNEQGKMDSQDKKDQQGSQKKEGENSKSEQALDKAEKALQDLESKSGEGNGDQQKQKEEQQQQKGDKGQGQKPDTDKKQSQDKKQGEGSEKEREGSKQDQAKKGNESQNKDREGKDEKKPGEKENSDRKETEEKKEEANPNAKDGENSGERQSKADRDAKLKDAGEDQLGKEDAGLGDKAKFQEAEVKNKEDEKYDERFTGQSDGMEEGEVTIVEPETSVQELRLAKPEVSKEEREQPIPLEYRDNIK